MKTSGKPGPSGPGRFSFITLGCKSNQYDSAAMAADLQQAGLRIADPADADVIFVNTCVVTGSAEAQCRKAIRQARRANPQAKLVVGGCMSRRAKDLQDTLPEADLILDPRNKGDLSGLLGVNPGTPGDGAWSDWPHDPAVMPYLRDRAFLKIQDGCDASCSYCIVPSVRGPSRSLEPVKVLDSVRKLMGSGSLEVVLSGIHLGQYGRGLDPSLSLEGLLDLLCDGGLPGRIRLSSIEPLEITDELINLINRSAGFICRHVHVPIQSASDRVLAGMERPYKRSNLTKALYRLQRMVPGVGIGCDIICGFPGETSSDFDMTEKVISDLGLPFVHAFPFSSRPGTKASRLRDNVPYQVKKTRVQRLRSLAEKNRSDFAAKQVGSFLKVALESGDNGGNTRWGLADNYLRVEVKECAGMQAGDLVDVYIVDSRAGTLVGKPGR